MSFLDLRVIFGSIHLPDPPYPLALAASVTLLILSEASSFYFGIASFKTISSFILLLAAFNRASSNFDILDPTSLLLQENRQAVCVMLGLAFNVIGDILLIPSKAEYHHTPGTSKKAKAGSSPRFKAGMCSFALAHFAYIAAFTSTTSMKTFRLADFAMTLVFGALLTDWLGLLKKELEYNSWFDVPESMRGMVMAYVVIIVSMVATATATDSGYQKIVGAWFFMFSDLCVASTTFNVENENSQKAGGRPEWKAASVGWIFYYGAQLVIAGCI